MFEFFDMITNFISTLITFAINIVNNILLVIYEVGIGTSVILNVVTFYMPDLVQALAIVIICYSIVINLINKGG